MDLLTCKLGDGKSHHLIYKKNKMLQNLNIKYSPSLQGIHRYTGICRWWLVIWTGPKNCERDSKSHTATFATSLTRESSLFNTVYRQVSLVNVGKLEMLFCNASYHVVRFCFMLRYIHFVACYIRRSRPFVKWILRKPLLIITSSVAHLYVRNKQV